MREVHTRDLRQLLHSWQGPRACVARMLVQEISARSKLFQVERGNEIDVLNGLRLRLSGFCSVAQFGGVEMLPGAEGSAHGRSDQQVWPLLAENLSCLLALGPDVEVPGLAVVRIIDGDVEGEAWREELVLGLRDFGRDSRWKLDLGDDRFCTEVSNASKQLLREDILLVWLQGTKT